MQQIPIYFVRNRPARRPAHQCRHPGHRFYLTDEAARYLPPPGDLLVLPYRSITTSGMLVAAQAAGNSPAQRHLPPLLEQVRDGVTGFVFHADNRSSLIHTIERALSNPHRRSNRAAQPNAP
jgi:glycosyltransferase involved in cell wall biosynthesis